MTSWKRISVVSSLAAYLLATTVVHALHDHSACDHCCPVAQTFSGTSDHGACDCDRCHCDCCHCDASDDHSAHQGLPSRSADCDHCFACRFLAVKSISPVAVVIVERSEPVRQLEPPQFVFAPVFRPDLPLSRGPPCA